jgi:predicted ATPase/DNA-binding winged helix-turn-helix (wHTH) protein
MIRIGALQVDFERREILRDDIPIQLGSRAFDILELLSEANGALVSKDTIMRTVWPHTIVEENNLQVQVSALRKILDSDRQLIITVAGRGYRLMRGPTTFESNESAKRLVASTQAFVATNGGHGEIFGRELPIAEVLRILQRFESLTLVGAGGIGKTRLAIEAARQAAPSFPDGVAFVSFASICEERSALEALAVALRIKTSGTPLSLDLIARAVRCKRLLVVLDNCEHVIDTAAHVATTLRNIGCVVLATSREPLRIPDETLRSVPALEVPTVASTKDAALLTDAVRLFIARVETLGPAFQADVRSVALIGLICRELDGIPLAIELAAARASTLGVEALSNRLGDRLRLLTGGWRTALPRHQTMRAALDWSYRLLNEPERFLLRQLSVFVGGFSFEAVRYLTRSDGLPTLDALDAFSGLIAKSMVAPQFGEEPGRYRLLEITREYAMEQLDANGERKSAQAVHAKYLLTLFEPTCGHRTAQMEISQTKKCPIEVDNVRAALEWSLSPTGDMSVGAALALAAVQCFYDARQ